MFTQQAAAILYGKIYHNYPRGILTFDFTGLCTNFMTFAGQILHDKVVAIK